MLNINKFLDISRRDMSNLNQGEIFLLKDLFKGFECNRILRSNCFLLGTLFSNYVNTIDDEITAIEKTSSGQQKYKNLMMFSKFLRRWFINEKC